jgi:hypothetical protein
MSSGPWAKIFTIAAFNVTFHSEKEKDPDLHLG